MSETELADDVATHDALTITVSGGDGFAWNDTISGVVTVYPAAHPVTFSVISAGVVTQNVDGFVSADAYAGIRDPFNPISGTDLAANPLPRETEWEETVLARDVTLAPGSDPREIAFSLTVPEQIALGDLCHVFARAVATDGVDGDRYAATGFVLLPPPAIQAVQNALHTFGDFRAVEVSNAPGENGATHHFVLDYVAPDALQGGLDGIRWELAETGDRVVGTAIINPQEHSLADRLRSLVHADRITIPVEFDRAELIDAGKAGLPAPSVVARLHELLDPFLTPVPTE